MWILKFLDEVEVGVSSDWLRFFDALFSELLPYCLRRINRVGKVVLKAEGLSDKDVGI